MYDDFILNVGGTKYITTHYKSKDLLILIRSWLEKHGTLEIIKYIFVYQDMNKFITKEIT